MAALCDFKKKKYYYKPGSENNCCSNNKEVQEFFFKFKFQVLCLDKVFFKNRGIPYVSNS